MICQNTTLANEATAGAGRVYLDIFAPFPQTIPKKGVTAAGWDSIPGGALFPAVRTLTVELFFSHKKAWQRLF